MTYSTIAPAIAEIIRAGGLTDLQPDDVAVGDYDILNGSHRFVVVLDYEGLQVTRAEFGTSFFNKWSVQATIGVPLTNALETHDEITALREHVLTQVGSNPHPTGTDEVKVEVVRGQVFDAPVEWGGNTWQMETLTMDVTELREY